MKRVVFFLALTALPNAAGAQEAQSATAWRPSLSDSLKDDARSPDNRRRTPPPPPLDGYNVPLSPKERLGVKYGRQWANNPDVPARGEDGGATFVFGSTLPVVVCAPLYVCDLRLQESEVVNDINIGDGVRWQVTPATQGSGANITTHVMIKPTEIGLVTNLVITTDRRAYTIKLVSREKDWMPSVSFFYPEAAQNEWSRYRTRQEGLREASQAAAPVDTAPNPDFVFDVSGDSPPWRPTRVYSNGAKTYIQFPRGVAHGDLPVLVALADDGGIFTEPSKQLVNYRYVEGRFEVDRVLDRAALISGVGWDQVKVKIDRQGRR